MLGGTSQKEEKIILVKILNSALDLGEYWVEWFNWLNVLPDCVVKSDKTWFSICSFTPAVSQFSSVDP